MDDSFDLLAPLKNNDVEKQKSRYKPAPAFSVLNGILKRKEILNNQRKSSRSSIIDLHRNLPTLKVTNNQINKKSKLDQRKMQLLEWQAEKEKRREKEKVNKKKPFLTGIVPVSLTYAPPPPLSKLKLKISRSGPVTRSQAKLKETDDLLSRKEYEMKKSFAPINAKFKPNLKFAKDIPTLPTLEQNKKITKTANKTTKASESGNSTVPNEKKGKCFLRQTNKLISENLLTKCESNLKMTLPSKPSGSKEPPEQKVCEGTNTSPLIKEICKGKLGLMQEKKDNIINDHCRMASNDSNYTSSTFRAKLESEVARIIKTCDMWEEVSMMEPLTESSQELLLAATGQARLLVSQKMSQFRSLVDACERCEPGAARVTVQDLHGFWDMVYMQVEDIDLRFKKMELLRARNWVEEVHENGNDKKKPSKNVKSKVSFTAKVKPAATGRIRDFISNAKKSGIKKVENVIPVDNEMSVKTFNGGFFLLQSPMKVMAPPEPESVPSTSNRKGSLSLAASPRSKTMTPFKQQNRASLAMLQATIVGKSVESEVASTRPSLTREMP